MMKSQTELYRPISYICCYVSGGGLACAESDVIIIPCEGDEWIKHDDNIAYIQLNHQKSTEPTKDKK